MTTPIQEHISKISLAVLNLNESLPHPSPSSISEEQHSVEPSQTSQERYEQFCLNIQDGIVNQNSAAIYASQAPFNAAGEFLDTLLSTTTHSGEFVEFITKIANDLGNAKTTIFSLAKSKNDLEDYLMTLLGNPENMNAFFQECERQMQSLDSPQISLDLLRTTIQQECRALSINGKALFDFVFETLSFIFINIFRKSTFNQSTQIKKEFEIVLKKILLAKISHPACQQIINEKPHSYFDHLQELSLKLGQREFLTTCIKR